MKKLMSKLWEKKNSKKGFTLVELIVVLVILAILAAIMVPALSGWIQKARDKQIILDARNMMMAVQAELYEDVAGGVDTNLADSEKTLPSSGTFYDRINAIAPIKSGDEIKYTTNGSTTTGADAAVIKKFTFKHSSGKTAKYEIGSNGNGVWTVS